VAIAGGLLLLGTRHWGTPVGVKVIKTEPAQIFEDAAVEMALVTLAFNRPAHEPWIYVEAAAKVEARVAGHWKMLKDTLSPGSLAGGETEEDVIVIPGNADRCRIHLSSGTAAASNSTTKPFPKSSSNSSVQPLSRPKS